MMPTGTPIAELLADVVGRQLRAGAELGFTAYDGSRAGSTDPMAVINIVDPRALNYLALTRSELGLARAYVAGYLDVEGDLFSVLLALTGEHLGALSWADRLEVLRQLGPRVLRPIPPPPEEVRPGWWWGVRHSIGRDSRAVSHHYDVSNRFYEWLLGPTMAYTCAVYPTPNAGLDEAQIEKVDLVCRKLDLQPGQRLLDVGCGWGTMVRHAAEQYGARVIGVTLSRQQAEWGQKRLAELGLTDRAEIRYGNYRDVPETGFDAISSIGLTEHIGVRNLDGYARLLAGKLRPRGRLLNHCITRPDTVTPVRRTGGFINRYVFPDGEIEGLAVVLGAIQNAGLEVRHEENFREHYARTTAAWSDNLEAHWDEAVAEVGVGRARAWRLYLAGSRLGFVQRRIELHQVLAVRTDAGDAGMPWRLDFSRRRAPAPAGG
jgi:cyclopropane-fatty-acyl-phospholipid synthase